MQKFLNQKFLTSFKILSKKKVKKKKNIKLSLSWTAELDDAEAVVKEELVVALLGEVEVADDEDDLTVGVVGVAEVGQGSVVGLVVGDGLNEVIGVEAGAAGVREEGAVEVGLVDDEDDAVDTRGTEENS